MKFSGKAGEYDFGLDNAVVSEKLRALADAIDAGDAHPAKVMVTLSSLKDDYGMVTLQIDYAIKNKEPTDG
jgi:hypothetical protein